MKRFEQLERLEWLERVKQFQSFRTFKQFTAVLLSASLATAFSPRASRTTEVRVDWQSEWEKTVQAAKKETRCEVSSRRQTGVHGDGADL
jgi:hypothetical protein